MRTMNMKPMRKSLSNVVVPVAATLLIAGCGSKMERPVYPVEGRVFVNKHAADKALVILTPLEGEDPKQWPQGYPHGTVAEDGSFRLSTYRDDDGAPAGEYAVTLLWPVLAPGEREMEIDKLAGRYANPKTSKYRAVVKADPAGTVLDPLQLP